MGDRHRVDVVELAIVDVALGQLGVVERKEVGEQGVVGLAEPGEITEAAERLGYIGMHLHVAQPLRPDAVVGNTVRSGH